MNFDLTRMKILMESLGNPQDRYKVIHIAGTNGKGSVAAITYSILKTAGKKVGFDTADYVPGSVVPGKVTF